MREMLVKMREMIVTIGQDLKDLAPQLELIQNELSILKSELDIFINTRVFRDRERENCPRGLSEEEQALQDAQDAVHEMCEDQARRAWEEKMEAKLVLRHAYDEGIKTYKYVGGVIAQFSGMDFFGAL